MNATLLRVALTCSLLIPLATGAVADSTHPTPPADLASRADPAEQTQPAREPRPPLTVNLNIESQLLGNALNEFGQQTGLQVIFFYSDVPLLTSPRLAGKFHPRVALEALLADTPLAYRFINPRTVAIVARSAETSAVRTRAGDTVGVTRPRLRLADNSPRPLAIVAQEENSDEANQESALAYGKKGEVKRSGSGTPEILVEDSRILNMDLPRSRDDVQPYVIFGKEEIEQSSARNIDDFLRHRLTSANSSFTPAQTDGGSNASLINIRGLGSEQTLVLIDGHRVASTNSTGRAGQPDLNGIPLAAIERIEVLPATASGIYGGGATGGVVNVILRRNYSGLETKLTYGDSFRGGGGTRNIDVASGFDLEGGATTLLLAGSYSDATDLRVEDREFLQRGRALILANNPGAFFGPFALPPIGGTTNIRSATGENLTLLPAFGGTPLNSPLTFVPYGYNGPASDQGARLAANAGQYNLDAANTAQAGAGGRQALVNSPVVKSLMVTARRRFSTRVEGFLDMSTMENSGGFINQRVGGFFFVPAGAPSNPFAEHIFVTTPTLGADGENEAVTRSARAVGGLIVKLPKSWRMAADYTWSRQRDSSIDVSSGLSSEANAAVSNGVTASGSPFDVFRDTNKFPVDFSEFLVADTVVSPTATVLKSAAVRFSGPLGWSMPGGEPTLAILMERRKESLDDYVIEGPGFNTIAFDRSQSTKSIHVESNVPLVSERNRTAGIYALAVELKARWEDYNMIGANTSSTFLEQPQVRVQRKFSSIDPTIGVRYQPVQDVTLRASYARGFLPPPLASLAPNLPIVVPGFIVSLFDQLSDPRRGGEIIGSNIEEFTSLSGGNPNLRPERSKSRSAGIILTPRAAPHLRISFDWTRIEKHNNVTSFGFTQETIDNELFLPGVVLRGDPIDGFDVGPVTGLDGRSINIARQNVEAYDIALGYQVTTVSFGTIYFSSAATRNVENVTQIIPTLPALESVGTNRALRWQANATVSWDYGQWGAGWTTRYFDSYWLRNDHSIVLDQGSATVPSQIYHDFFAHYRTDSSPALGMLSNVEVRLSIQNVFDKTPPIITTAPYYSTFGDPRLASYSISLAKSFD